MWEIQFKNSTDKLIINGQLTGAGVIETVKFADGTAFTAAQLLTKLQNLGTNANEYLSGSDLAEQLFGLAGDDQLYGYGGNDNLDGGDGNDNLTGGDGNDTYVLNTDFEQDNLSDTSGTDTVQFGANLLAANAVFSGDNTTLTISFKGSTDKLTIYDQLSAAGMIETVKFADGTTYTAAQIKTMLQNLGTNANDSLYGSNLAEKLFGLAGEDSLYANGGNDTLDGGEGNDYLSGGDGNDTLDAGKGNDTLTGDAGNDLYTVNVDFGQDNLSDTSGTDTVQFGAGLLAANAVFSGDSSNALTIRFKGSTDKLTISDQLAGAGVIETVKFADGTTFTAAQINALLQNLGTSQQDSLDGSRFADKLLGLAGNDYLMGNAGNDTLDGGEGNDYLFGGIGNDLYIVDSLNDMVYENVNEGTDTVQSSVSFTLGDNVEHLTLTGTAAINGTGNTLNNTLIGNAVKQ